MFSEDNSPKIYYKIVFLQTSVIKCHFIVMASVKLLSPLRSVREAIISAEGVRKVIISADERV
jgi:hypothetical protein